MALEEYRQRRRFNRTPEPEGAVSQEDQPDRWRFVIQKHDATRLHYDLRLELGGVLKSWAVPKGPTLDPRIKRLAVHVEDHPLEYLLFEGLIPANEYGGGTVMVWDTGTWTPRSDAHRDYESGELKFHLHGQKVAGGFMLKRLDNLASGERNQWLWIKENDSSARVATQFDLLAEYNNSVLTGRNLEEIAADKDAIWSSAGNDSCKPRKSAPTETIFDANQYRDAKATALPDSIQPSLPTAARSAPTGNEWVHEIKHDGYRMVSHREADDVRFRSRSGRDWTDKVASLIGAIRDLPCMSVVLDGEVVVLTDDGKSSFPALQRRIGSGRDGLLRYYVFDLLFLDGYDLTRIPLLERKELLASLTADCPGDGRLIYSEHLEGDGPTIFQQAAQLGVEGIVSKRVDKRYVFGRTEHWVKTKCLQSREFVIGGYTPPTASRKGIGAILLGTRETADQLRFVGKVGTGFTHDMLISIRKRLDTIRRDASPFVNLSKKTADKGTVWVTPNVIAEIEFGGWTTDRLIRFGSFRGIRDDLGLDDIELQMPEIDKEDEDALARAPQDSRQIQLDPRFLELPDELASLKLSHPDRVVYPEMGITKLGVATYYAQVARWMLPHLANRPLSLLRCPGGVSETCFFQKRAPQGLHESVERIELPSKEGEKVSLVVRDVVGLLALVQFGVLEFHVRGVRSDRPDRPDRMVLDLDPDENLAWGQTKSAAREFRELLLELGLESFLKTTGGKGLHIVVPIRRRHSWAEVKRFTGQIGSLMEGRFPRRFTMNPSKSARKGRILIDTLRNTRGATAVAAYSTRARANASVSVPIDWSELDFITSSDSMDPQAVIRRLARSPKDPWALLGQIDQGITKKAWRLVDARK